MKFWWVFPVLFIVACGRSPEEATQELQKMNVAPTSDSLLVKTKEGKSEEVAKMLVQSGVDPNARQRNGMTALMSAAFNGQHDVAKALLEKGAEVNAEAGGFSALSLAVERNDRTMVELLLKHGAEARTRPGKGLSALEKAQQKENADLVQLLESAAK